MKIKISKRHFHVTSIRSMDDASASDNSDSGSSDVSFIRSQRSIFYRNPRDSVIFSYMQSVYSRFHPYAPLLRPEIFTLIALTLFESELHEYINLINEYIYEITIYLVNLADECIHMQDRCFWLEDILIRSSAEEVELVNLRSEIDALLQQIEDLLNRLITIDENKDNLSSEELKNEVVEWTMDAHEDRLPIILGVIGSAFVVLGLIANATNIFF